MKHMGRAFAALLALTLCLTPLSVSALAAEHVLKEENNWSIAGELIMPGDTFRIESTREVTQTDDLNKKYVYIHGAALEPGDARIYIDKTDDKIDINDFLKGIVANASVKGKLTDLAGGEGLGLALTSEAEYEWTTGYINKTGYPIEVRNVRGHNSGGGLVTPVDSNPQLYVIPITHLHMDFVVYENQYAIAYEDMTEEEIAQAPDHFDVTQEEQTLVLPVPQRAGKIFRYYTGRNGIALDGVISADGKTFTCVYDWDTLKDAGSGIYTENLTLRPVFGSAYTVELHCGDGKLEKTYFAIELDTAGDFDLYSQTPTREGYTFLGWSTEENGGADSLLPKSWSLTDDDKFDFDFYAVWQADENSGENSDGTEPEETTRPEQTVKAKWVKDSVGWWYDNGDGTYPANEWKKIDGVWYFFKSTGYMAANEWCGGYWLDASGAWTYQPKGSWHQDATGWWFGDTSGWYAKNQWQVIDGVWYYFNRAGYMAANEWCGGYWLNASGAWTYQPKGSWHQDATGWWFGDTSGWYAKNETVKIDGVSYTFNAAGYWAE